MIVSAIKAYGKLRLQSILRGKTAASLLLLFLTVKSLLHTIHVVKLPRRGFLIRKNNRASDRAWGARI